MYHDPHAPHIHVNGTQLTSIELTQREIAYGRLRRAADTSPRLRPRLDRGARVARCSTPGTPSERIAGRTWCAFERVGRLSAHGGALAPGRRRGARSRRPERSEVVATLAAGLGGVAAPRACPGRVAELTRAIANELADRGRRGRGSPRGRAHRGSRGRRLGRPGGGQRMTGSMSGRARSAGSRPSGLRPGRRGVPDPVGPMAERRLSGLAAPATDRDRGGRLRVRGARALRRAVDRAARTAPVRDGARARHRSARLLRLVGGVRAAGIRVRRPEGPGDRARGVPRPVDASVRRSRPPRLRRDWRAAVRRAAPKRTTGATFPSRGAVSTSGSARRRRTRTPRAPGGPSPHPRARAVRPVARPRRAPGDTPRRSSSRIAPARAARSNRAVAERGAPRGPRAPRRRS